MQAESSLFENREDRGALAELEGFHYVPGFLSLAEQSDLIVVIERLPFREFEFHGYLGKRRIVSFGWRYEYSGRGVLKPADDIPEFLLGLRAKAAPLAGLQAAQLEQVLVTEYRPGAGIGWHRDKPVFDRVVGVSLLAPCTLRFRRNVNSRTGSKIKNRERVSMLIEPGSAYVLAGSVREEWEHSIAGVDELRYAVTFRSLRQQ